MARIVVTRPEPPPEDDVPVKRTPKLSKEEVQALLAIERAPKRPSLWKRGRWVFLVTSLLGTAAHIFLGTVGVWISVVLTVGAIVYTAYPLFRHDPFT